MHADTKEACEQIDAAIFSGEGIFDEDLLSYLERWRRAVDNQDDETKLPHEVLFRRASDAATRYAHQTGPGNDASTEVVIEVLHTQDEMVITSVRAETKLDQPMIYTMTGARRP